MAEGDYDRGVLAGQESLDRELDACKDKLEAAEAKLAEATEDLDSCREVREELEARLAEVEKELEVQTAMAGDYRRMQDEVIEQYRIIESQRASMDRARELAEGEGDSMGDVTGRHLNRRARLAEIARLLSGDE